MNDCHCVYSVMELEKEFTVNGELVWDKVKSNYQLPQTLVYMCPLYSGHTCKSIDNFSIQDDKSRMDFVVAAANLRAYAYSIQQKSRFDVKCKYHPLIQWYIVLITIQNSIFITAWYRNSKRTTLSVGESKFGDGSTAVYLTNLYLFIGQSTVYVPPTHTLAPCSYGREHNSSNCDNERGHRWAHSNGGSQGARWRVPQMQDRKYISFMYQIIYGQFASYCYRSMYVLHRISHLNTV